jgi:hypothetical protein
MSRGWRTLWGLCVNRSLLEGCEWCRSQFRILVSCPLLSAAPTITHRPPSSYQKKAYNVTPFYFMITKFHSKVATTNIHSWLRWIDRHPLPGPAITQVYQKYSSVYIILFIEITRAKLPPRRSRRWALVLRQIRAVRMHTKEATGPREEVFNGCYVSVTIRCEFDISWQTINCPEWH